MVQKIKQNDQIGENIRKALDTSYDALIDCFEETETTTK